MRWRCDYVDEAGRRCPLPATFRYLFHWDHPFDFADRCENHPTAYCSQKTVLSQEMPFVLRGQKIVGEEAQTLKKILQEEEDDPNSELRL